MTPLRLQNSGLKTTATFLEDKDIQNKVEKRKNSLMLFQNKSLESVIEFNHKKVEKVDKNTLQEKHTKAKSKTLSGRKQSNEQEKTLSKILMVQENLT